MDVPGASSAVWLTKAVDTAVSLLVHVGSLYGAKPEETTCATRTNSSCVWREITDFTPLSFPEDCARLKLSSARASQAGLKEMIIE